MNEAVPMLFMLIAGFGIGVTVGFLIGSEQMLRRCRRLARRVAREHDIEDVKKCLKHRSGERPSVKLVAT